MNSKFTPNLARTEKIAADFDAQLNQREAELFQSINQANAWKSTGPTTETGKRVSSMTALRTCLTGKTILMPSDDADRYKQLVLRFIADLKPTGDRESELAQSMADAQWRLNRIPSLEMGIHALGRLEFADQFAAHAPDVAALLLESYIFIRRQKELKNLALQESRLRRQYAKDVAELALLQKQRSEQEAKERPATAEATPSAKTAQPLSANANGFEFENSTIDAQFTAPRLPQAA